MKENKILNIYKTIAETAEKDKKIYLMAFGLSVLSVFFSMLYVSLFIKPSYWFIVPFWPLNIYFQYCWIKLLREGEEKWHKK